VGACPAPEARWTLPAPEPVAAAGGSSLVSPFSILLARTAGNGCQRVTFAFHYSAIATLAPSSVRIRRRLVRH
jgi:hypothetical protein